MALCLSLQSCADSTSESEFKVFEKPRVVETKSFLFQLNRSSHIANTIERIKLSSGKSWFDSYAIKIQFSDLTPQEFELLKKTYGGFSQRPSQVVYKKGEVYGLEDFLPAPFGAVLNHIFVPEKVEISLPLFVPGLQNAGYFSKRTHHSVSLLGNCWGTIYELLRYASSPSTVTDAGQASDSGQASDHEYFYQFYAPAELMAKFFKDERFTELLKGFDDTIHGDSSDRNKGLQPGDLLLIGEKYLQHVAMFIDDDLYFEKAGAGENALYRFTDFETIVKTWPSDLYGYSWRRPKRNPIPKPEVFFNLHSSLETELSLDLFSAEEKSQLTASYERDDKTGQINKVQFFSIKPIRLNKTVSGRWEF